MAGLTLVPGLIPPSGVRSSNTAATNSQFRYNLNTGAAFNINCTSTHTTDDFTVSLHKDGVVISDGDLVETTLTEIVISATQTFIHLQFLNFQPVHDGVYHCFASASDTDEELSSDLYLYGSGEDCTCVWSGRGHVEIHTYTLHSAACYAVIHALWKWSWLEKPEYCSSMSAGVYPLQWHRKHMKSGEARHA